MTKCGRISAHIPCKKTASLRRFFNVIGYTSSFCDDRSRLRAQKNRRSLQHFKTTRPFRPLLRAWIMPPYPAAVCNFCSFDSFSVCFARDHSGSSPYRRQLARLCFNRDTPCLFRPLNTTDSHDKLRYQFCNSGKKQLFHVKHRFLQCFSLEFYLLFALSCCRFV